jgi:hypothetical protein
MTAQAMSDALVLFGAQRRVDRASPDMRRYPPVQGDGTI